MEFTSEFHFIQPTTDELSKVMYLPINSMECIKRILRKRTPFDRSRFSQDMKIPCVRFFSLLSVKSAFGGFELAKLKLLSEV